MIQYSLVFQSPRFPLVLVKQSQGLLSQELQMRSSGVFFQLLVLIFGMDYHPLKVNLKLI
jgi:hypothetical protein